MVPTWAISSLEVIFLEFSLKIFEHSVDREIDAAFEVHWVHAGGHGLGAFPDDSMGEHSGGRRTVARQTRGLGCDLLDHLGAHVLKLVLELNFIGDGDAVLGDAWPEGLIERNITSLRAERHADRTR